ncbi:hypothetical protein DFR33_103162 [Bradymonas sediminis]|nr:hypothetical protein DFR33_103162 [Bradymonas sediminis]
MHLVDILTDKHMIALAAHALSPRANPENRAAQPTAEKRTCLRANAEQKTAENQDIQVPINHAKFQTPAPTRSGVLAFAPPSHEVIH